MIKFKIKKIGDFGVSTVVNNSDDRVRNSAGTYHFMSPESQKQVNKGFSGKAADIWALGVTFYAFTFLILPFDDENLDKIMKSIQTQKFYFFYILLKLYLRLVFPKTPKISKEYTELLKSLLEKDPKKRIKIGYLL